MKFFMRLKRLSPGVVRVDCTKAFRIFRECGASPEPLFSKDSTHAPLKLGNPVSLFQMFTLGFGFVVI